LFVYKRVLPPGYNPTAVNKYIILYDRNIQDVDDHGGRSVRERV